LSGMVKFSLTKPTIMIIQNRHIRKAPKNRLT
jgi:hypothetical protein